MLEATWASKAVTTCGEVGKLADVRDEDGDRGLWEIWIGADSTDEGVAAAARPLGRDGSMICDDEESETTMGETVGVVRGAG